MKGREEEVHSPLHFLPVKNESLVTMRKIENNTRFNHSSVMNRMCITA